jgi:glutamate-1-semialdehyde aminotransferase
LGERLREGLNQAFAQAGLRAQALGTGSLSNIHFDDAPTNDARGFIAGAIAAGSLVNLLHLTMIRHGVLSATRLMYCTSTSMTEIEIDAAVTAMHESLAELRPYIEQGWPALVH